MVSTDANPTFRSQKPYALIHKYYFIPRKGMNYYYLFHPSEGVR